MNARQRRDRRHQQVLRTRGLLRQLRREQALRAQVDRIMRTPGHLIAALFGVTGETDEQLSENLERAGIARSYQFRGRPTETIVWDERDGAAPSSNQPTPRSPT